jgi:hypothetical protein
MSEIWKDIPGYEDYYQVSNMGEIRSLDRIVNSSKGDRIVKGKILSKIPMKSGYVSIRLSKNNIGRTFTVHKLVCLAFLNFSSNSQTHIDHINNDKSDNRLENLQLASARFNTTKTKRKNCSSKYVGVYYVKRKKRWDARSKVNGLVKHLGYYKTEYEAHLAYQKEMSLCQSYN